MAIKLPDPGNGIPEQKTGNDEWTNMKIVRDNFADQSNAASRLVGTESSNVLDVSAWSNVNKAFNTKAFRNYLGNSSRVATKSNPGFTYTLDEDFKKLNAGDTVVLSCYLRADNITTKQAGDRAFIEVSIATTNGNATFFIAENNLSTKGKIEKYYESAVTLPGKPTKLSWGYSSLDCYRGPETDLELSQVKLEVSTQGRTAWTPSFVDLHSINNTTKDSKTNLLLGSGDAIPSNSAASKLVGTARGQIPLAEQVAKAYLTDSGVDAGNRNANDFEIGSIYRTNGGSANVPEGSVAWNIRTFALDSTNTVTAQIAHGTYATNYVAIRGNRGGEWTEWTSLSSYPGTYFTTTAAGANVVVSATGQLTRASSSLKYKDVISKLELDSDLYDKAMQVKPIIYRSKSKIDPKDWHFMSFIAEELGELDPSLTQWLVKTHDDDGNELDDPTKEAEGINLNAICAVLHATNIYQDKKLKELEQRLTALESNNEPKQ